MSDTGDLRRPTHRLDPQNTNSTDVLGTLPDETSPQPARPVEVNEEQPSTPEALPDFSAGRAPATEKLPEISSTSSPTPEAQDEHSPAERPEPEALPDFEAPEAAPLAAATEGEALGHEDAHEFITHSAKEHRVNLVAMLLVLLAPAAMFYTLWWPTGEASFAEANPRTATITGIAIALSLIVVGLLVHFVPRRRHALLERVEKGHVALTEESAKAGAQHRREARGKNIAFTVIGALLVVAALAVGLFAVNAAGITQVFLYAAIAFTALAFAFAFFYPPFTTRRAARHVGHR